MTPACFGSFSFGAPPVLNSYLYNQPGRGGLLGSNQTSIFGGDQVSPSSLLAAYQTGQAPGVTAGTNLSLYAAVPQGLSDAGIVAAEATAPDGFLGIPWLGWAMILGGTLLVLSSGHFLSNDWLIEKERRT